MAIFEGAGVALVTPFTSAGDVNFDKLEEILEEQIAEGTSMCPFSGRTGNIHIGGRDFPPGLGIVADQCAIRVQQRGKNNL